MIPNNRKIRFALGLFCLTLIVIGVTVWPPPREALAVDTIFRARVDWNGHTRNDNQVRVRLTTRAAIGQPSLDSRVMPVARHIEGISYYQLAFTPDNRARVWEISIENIRQHTWIPTTRVMQGRGEMVAGIVSELKAAFVCIDQ